MKRIEGTFNFLNNFITYKQIYDLPRHVTVVEDTLLVVEDKLMNHVIQVLNVKH